MILESIIKNMLIAYKIKLLNQIPLLEIKIQKFNNLLKKKLLLDKYLIAKVIDLNKKYNHYNINLNKAKVN